VWFFTLSDTRYHALLREIRRLDDDLAQLRTQHERLRGRFYGGRHQPTDPDTPAPGTRQEKDQILREFLGARRAKPPA
jgi:hypothetical protein